MELKEARAYSQLLRDGAMSKAYKTGVVIITLDDRITELEAERDVYKNSLELMEADRNDLRAHVKDLAELVKEMS